MKELEPLTEEMLNSATECLKCIAHPKRLQILAYLEKGAACVGDIESHLDISQPVTSEHLRLMEAKGILKSEREGRKVFYSLAIDELRIILNCIRSNKLKRN